MRTKRAKDVLEKRLGPLTFGGFMRACRMSQDKTQIEMADFLGIGRSTFCDIEKGRQGVSPKLAKEIAVKCGFSLALAVELAVKDRRIERSAGWLGEPWAFRPIVLLIPFRGTSEPIVSRNQ